MTSLLPEESVNAYVEHRWYQLLRCRFVARDCLIGSRGLTKFVPLAINEQLSDNHRYA